MRLYALAVYLFLYGPIAVIALLSFNAGRHASSFEGLSLRWYGETLSNPFMLDALRQSLTVAALSATLATIAGTMAALALASVGGRVRTLFDAAIYVAVMVPGIVIGIATLIALVTLFDGLNPLIAAAWPALGSWASDPPQLALGTGSLVAAHGLFALALVVIVVRTRLAGMDRSLIEASADLGATPWGTFRQVTLPQIAPGILAGFLLAFTFSFDDFVIAFFVAGSETTLPIYVFSSIRRGVTPEINVIGTLVLAASLTLLILAQLMLRRGRAAAPAAG